LISFHTIAFLSRFTSKNGEYKWFF